MKVLLVGIDSVPHLGKSFKSALQRAGHTVQVVNPQRAYTFMDRWPVRRLIQRISPGNPSAYALFRALLLRASSRFGPDVVLATGSVLDQDTLKTLRNHTRAPLVMYSTDSPFNPAISSPEVVNALPYWDVIATPRRASIPKLKEYCRGNVFYLPFGYDPELHYPEQAATQKEKERVRSDVVFIGGCDPDRVPYLDPLARAEDIKVHLYGGYYRFTPALRRCKRGYAYGRTYRLVLGAASVAICLVRRANGDGHVMRTFETPACGAFQLAERTEEHEEIFVENREAVFFDNPQELLDKARFYAVNAPARRKIAECGYRRITGAPNTYSDRVKTLLKNLDS